MEISEFGGEFALINRIQQIIATPDSRIMVGIGDDAAVFKKDGNSDRCLLVTTDTLVEDVHYRIRWSQARQIGIKAVEANVSDIAAMGGAPTGVFVSLVLSPEISVEWVEDLYRGMAESCRHHRVTIAGGDTTHGVVTMISITVLGEVAADHLCLRSHAREGDLLAVTGPLGGSAAALDLMNNDLKPTDYLKRKHLTPRCRADIAPRLAPRVNAMIDISDGLASEIHHLCNQSHTGAHIHAEKIPLHPDVIHTGRLLKTDPLGYALSGGEDFELLFTIAPDMWPWLEKESVSCHIIGHVVADAEGRMLVKEGHTQSTLQGGYNHFE